MKVMVIGLIAISLFVTSFRPAEFCRRQGIKGHVYLVQGNQMPSPEEPRSKPPGIKTKLYVYELTNLSQVTRNGAFYNSISTRLVKEVSTDGDGSFKVRLKPGWYSLFVKKGDLFYSNIFDGKSNIHPVEVKKGEFAEEDFKADYDAAY
jgi:hypothetical protein